MLQRNHRQRHSTGSLPNYILSPESVNGKDFEFLYQPVKPIMKARTLDESLSSTARSWASANSGDSSSSSASSNNRSSSAKNIRFNEIQIREYARTIGDNPSCSSGPPIGISWEYNPNVISMKVEEYEHLRPRRRSQVEMVIPRYERFRLLREEWDIPPATIAASVRSAVKIKHQRRVTVSNLGSKFDRWEELMEKASRKVVRTLMLRRSTSAQVRRMEQECDRIRQARMHLLSMHQQQQQQQQSQQAQPAPRITTTPVQPNPITAVEESDEEETDKKEKEEEAKPKEAAPTFQPEKERKETTSESNEGEQSVGQATMDEQQVANDAPERLD